MSENPYTAPTPESVPFPGGEISAEQALDIRKAHIKHESSVRSIRILFYLGGTLCLIGGAIGAWNAIQVSSLQNQPGADVSAAAGLIGEMTAAIVTALILGVSPIIAARGIRRLKTWGRILGIIVSAVGLFAFPVGTIVNIYILYILIVPKSSLVFSPAYSEVIALTPGIKHRVSKAVWIFLGLALLLLVIAFFSPAVR